MYGFVRVVSKMASHHVRVYKSDGHNTIFDRNINEMMLKPMWAQTQVHYSTVSEH
jgi:hypothetical protein